MRSIPGITVCKLRCKMRSSHFTMVYVYFLSFYGFEKSDEFAAPVIKDAGIEYSVNNFNGSFFKEGIYRQLGSPEVDAAWEALGVDCKNF